jgi:8-oxo-dGTP diphosphatase
MPDKIFNVRVYGILINEQNELLVTDEYHHGMNITKFPGGGLQFGEGTKDALHREMFEETGSEIEIIRHFYTTDFFQQSAFNPAQQVISIYYLIRPVKPLNIEVKNKPFNFDVAGEGAQIFRWIPLQHLKKTDLTLPIDQFVAGIILDEKPD